MTAAKEKTERNDMTTLLIIVFSLLVGVLVFRLFDDRRSYRSDERVTEAFLLMAESPDLDVTPEDSGVGDIPYYVIVSSPIGELRFWNANQWYAWANQGEFKSATAPEQNFKWRGVMPSRQAVRKMRRRIGHRLGPECVRPLTKGTTW
jgi:hypothetical protein